MAQNPDTGELHRLSDAEADAFRKAASEADALYNEAGGRPIPTAPGPIPTARALPARMRGWPLIQEGMPVEIAGATFKIWSIDKYFVQLKAISRAEFEVLTTQVKLYEAEQELADQKEKAAALIIKSGGGCSEPAEG